MDVDKSNLSWSIGPHSWYKRSGTNLDPDEIRIYSTSSSNSNFGFGRIYVNVTVFADNADSVWREEEGFVIGPFVII